MGKKTEYTPRSQIRSALRQAWLRSRERSRTLKRDEYTCQSCNKKQSKRKGKEVKVSVHHKNGVGNWDKIIDAIYKELLCHPDNLITLCDECHNKQEHKHGGN